MKKSWLQLLIAVLWLSCLVTAKNASNSVNLNGVSKKPNFVFILTDDQDWHMQSLDYMPLLHKHLIDHGTLFDQHYCTVSICCPSRVNLWTGRAAHNTNVTDLFPPYGGYPKFVREGLNENWLPVWLQQLGYQTYYTGKLFNSHSVETYDKPPVKGFNGSDFLLDPYTYDYYNAYFTRNAETPLSYVGQYSPDLVASKAAGFLDDAVKHEQPFFIGVAPVAPHSNVKLIDDDGTLLPRAVMSKPQYASRHAQLFENYTIPRTPNFNPDFASGVGWVKTLHQQNDTVIQYFDDFQRDRLRALQAVDETVDALVRQLEAYSLIDNTYIIYSTDNGYHIGQHRLPPGKECPFETDIHIPLIIRGPGVPQGKVAGVVSSHTDLTPTILKLAGSTREDLDGSPLPLNEAELAEPESGEHVNVEFWGRAIPEGKYLFDEDIAMNNTYKAIRVIGADYNVLYVVWCTGDKEYYDLKLDPDQLHNYLDPTQNTPSTPTTQNLHYHLAGRTLPYILTRLDALLLVAKSCVGETCRKPWAVLHPPSSSSSLSTASKETKHRQKKKGAKQVQSLEQALSPQFDDFYAQQPKVHFDKCNPGYLVDDEGPQKANSFSVYTGGRESFGDGQVVFGHDSPKMDARRGHWSWWT